MSAFRNVLTLCETAATGETWLERLEEYVGLEEVVQILGTVLVAIVVAFVFRRYVLSYFEQLAKKTENDVDDRLVYFLSRFYKGILFFVVLVVALRILRVEITPLLAGAGIFGIAIAYAAKDILGNFLSGVFLLVDRPIRLGDRIRIERIGSQWSAWGDVVDVGLRSTTVKNTDGVHVTYPNAKLAESIIKNFSPSDKAVRFRIRVLADLGSDLPEGLRIMQRLAEEEERVLKEPAPSVVLRSVYSETGGLAHAGAVLELRCYVDDIRVRTRLRSDLLLRIVAAFAEAGIQLARPRLAMESDSEPRP